MAGRQRKANIMDAIDLQISMFAKIGCWPAKNKRKTLLSTILYIGTWIADLSFQVFLFMELYKNIRNNEFKELSALVAYMASDLPYILKRVIFDVKSKDILKVIDTVEDPKFHQYTYQEGELRVRKSTMIARAIMRTYQIFVTLLIVIIFLMPFLSKDFTYSVRFSVFDWGRFRLGFHLYQVLSIGLAGYIHSTLDIFVFGLISIGTIQFSLLHGKLLNARKWAGLSVLHIEQGMENPEVEFDHDLDEKLIRYLSKCVNYHIDIINYCQQLEEIYSFYFLLQFSGSVLAMCCTWFQLILDNNTANILFFLFYTLALLLQLGMFCVYGNNLLLESTEIRAACYFSEWNKSNVKVRKYLLLIMERSKKPTFLTAGKFKILGLATYGGLLQSTYSFFALMNRVYQKN